MSKVTTLEPFAQKPIRKWGQRLGPRLVSGGPSHATRSHVPPRTPPKPDGFKLETSRVRPGRWWLMAGCWWVEWLIVERLMVDGREVDV